MRDRRSFLLQPCLVVLPAGSTTLEIRTSAQHALDILSGRTKLMADGARAYDTDGKLLSRQALSMLAGSSETYSETGGVGTVRPSEPSFQRVHKLSRIARKPLSLEPVDVVEPERRRAPK